MPYQLGESPINGGDGWIRANDLLRMKQLHYHCATSPHMASREGFEPPPTVLETDMLPLHYRDVFLLYMARPERFELPTSGFEDLLSIQLN